MKFLKRHIPDQVWERYKDVSLHCVKQCRNKFIPPLADGSSHLQPMVLHKWPESSLHIQYEKCVTGPGNGEARLAYILGGRIAGNGTSYDIIIQTPFGETKIEVKSVKSYSNNVLAGIMGIMSMQDIRAKTSYVLNKISAALERKQIFDSFDEVDSQLLNYFLSNTMQSLSNGSFKLYTTAELELVLRLINEKKVQLSNQNYFHLRKEKFCGEDIELTSREHIKITKVIGNKLKTQYEYSLFEIFDEAFEDDVFDDYKSFIDELVMGPPAQNVFADVDGLFIVTEIGYIFIPKEKLNVALQYAWTGHGSRPNFRLNYSAFE